MCQHCSNTLQVNKVGKTYDPTRTTVLRASFVKDLNKRFNRITQLITEAIVKNDVFGLSRPATYQAPRKEAFNFPRATDKVAAFMDWLNSEINDNILEVSQFQQLGQATETAWTNMYIEDSYKRGVIRSRYELEKAGYPVPGMEETGGIAASMANPFHIDRVGLIFTRTYEDLKGITSTMSNQISKILGQGIADGDGPRDLARKLNTVITGQGDTLAITDSIGRFIPARRRAEILARTEIIRAHHSAMIQEYKNWGEIGLVVQAELATAGDDRVCSQCQELEGKVYTLDQATNLIPVHPQCRCIALPVLPDEELPTDEVAVNMRPEDAAEYLQYKAEYTDFWNSFDQNDLKLFKEGVEAETRVGDTRRISNILRAKVETEMPGYLEAIKTWQRSTHKVNAMKLKMAARKYEKTTEVLVKNTTTPGFMEAIEENPISKESYLRIRAFNQAYMEKIGIDEEILYRGTDGNTGISMRQALINLSTEEKMARTKWTIEDANLAGYTSDRKTALEFARLDEPYEHRWGVAIQLAVSRKEIIMHKDLLSGITMSFMHEKEFIILGGKKEVLFKNIMFYGNY